MTRSSDDTFFPRAPAPESAGARAVLENSGHGNVVPRPDGAKTRCGGPGLCRTCDHDARTMAYGRRLERATYMASEPRPTLDAIVDTWSRIAVVQGVVVAARDPEGRFHLWGDPEELFDLLFDKVDP